MKKLSAQCEQKFTAYILWLAIFSVLLVMTACGPSAPPVSNVEEAAPEQIPATTVVEEEESREEEAYPPPPPTLEVPAADESYPIEPPPPTFEPSPVPENYPAVEEVFAEPRFRLDLPLEAGSTIVTGQAPPDLALAIVDVTYNGVVLGTGISDADGNFSIGVNELPAGNRVGITFSELQPGKTLVEMSEEYFPHRGQGFMNLPNVGIYFDTALVQP